MEVVVDNAKRELLCVDLKGLRAALLARARHEGVRPSHLVRRALKILLGEQASLESPQGAQPQRGARGTERVSLRLSAADASLIRRAAQRAKLSPGAYVAGLANAVPVLVEGGTPTGLVAALNESTYELATMRRGLLRLADLLRRGEGQAAITYWNMLLGFETALRRHLQLASDALVMCSPARAKARQREDEARDKRGDHHG
jgi:hypothetical protein